MSTAVLEPTGPPAAATDELAPAASRERRTWWWLGLAGVLALALILRIWGSGHGLPWAYNVDENNHFVPKAIAFFNGDWNPHYFDNPPAYSYLLKLVFGVWFGGRAAVAHAFATHPGEVFQVARVVSAVLGTLAVWLLYIAGARLIDRRVALLAAALLSVSFLPVFYSHLALNDVPTLFPLTLALVGTAGVLRYGRPLDYLVAGLGLGLACATKYTGGIALLPLLAAAGAQFTAPDGHRAATTGLVLAGATAVVCFFATDPYSLLDFSAFRDGLGHQSSVADDAAGKLGMTHKSGVVYYLWSLTWGMGWIPALAAVGGAVALWRDERRLVAVLVPAPVLFLIFMGAQGRYFGRWLMPIIPIVCLLAAYAALELARWLARLRPALAPSLAVAGAAALCLQGLIHSVHADLVLSRTDTRNLTRQWLVDHVPVGSKLVIEPVVPDLWVMDPGHPSPVTDNGYRWQKFPTSHTQVAADGSLFPGAGRSVNIEDYERTLRPDLIALYEASGYCWVITGSTQAGRAAANPRRVPGAVAYYRALDGGEQAAFRASPFGGDQRAVPFNFDFTFDYYPLAYHRPGPVMTVYRLTGGGC
ncbi:MAG: glycosyltransferase family 39 protein [Actinobacteria bacterium]|nr:MAG: glycosyltransferase family 39 protein [Actinomycetota bacterium]